MNEDVSPIEDGDFPLSSEFSGGYSEISVPGSDETI